MSKIHQPLLAAVVVLTLAVLAYGRDDQALEKAAVKAAETWLGLVDSSDYGASWNEAATIFKSRVDKEQWGKAARGVRAPLGKLKSRKLSSATYSKQLPGAPDGEYVVIQYETSFENKNSAVETVTPALEKDGKWRVSGYYIR
jgi:hypothetical protein